MAHDFGKLPLALLSSSLRAKPPEANSCAVLPVSSVLYQNSLTFIYSLCISLYYETSSFNMVFLSLKDIQATWIGIFKYEDKVGFDEPIILAFN